MITFMAFVILSIHIISLLVIGKLGARLKNTYIFIGMKGELVLFVGVFIVMVGLDNANLHQSDMLLLSINSAIRSFSLVSQILGNPIVRKDRWDVKQRKKD